MAHARQMVVMPDNVPEANLSDCLARYDYVRGSYASARTLAVDRTFHNRLSDCTEDRPALEADPPKSAQRNSPRKSPILQRVLCARSAFQNDLGGKNGKKRAIIATARKLAVLLHRLWVSGEVYEPLRNTKRTRLAAA